MTRDVIRCPDCGNLSRILGGKGNYKTFKDGTKRRTRECRTCGSRWRTYELPEDVHKDLKEEARNHRSKRVEDLEIMLKVMNRYARTDIDVKRAIMAIKAKAENDGIVEL